MSQLDDGHWVPSLGDPAREPIRSFGPPRGADRDAPQSLGNGGLEDPLRKLGTRARSPDGRAGPFPVSAPARAAPAARIPDLQGLRQWVLERLDSLEAMARQRPAPSPVAGEPADLERTLQQRLAELEEARRQLCAEAERQEQEWSASLSQLETDRRLLAEAWERLERQRIESLGGSQPHPPSQAHGQSPPRGAPATMPHTAVPAPARSVAVAADPNNPVAQAILRQFQTLCRDVRCNAEAHRDSP